MWMMWHKSRYWNSFHPFQTQTAHSKPAIPCGACSPLRSRCCLAHGGGGGNRTAVTTMLFCIFGMSIYIYIYVCVCVNVQMPTQLFVLCDCVCFALAPNYPAMHVDAEELEESEESDEPEELEESEETDEPEGLEESEDSDEPEELEESEESDEPEELEELEEFEEPDEPNCASWRAVSVLPWLISMAYGIRHSYHRHDIHLTSSHSWLDSWGLQGRGTRGNWRFGRLVHLLNDLPGASRVGLSLEVDQMVRWLHHSRVTNRTRAPLRFSSPRVLDHTLSYNVIYIYIIIYIY